MKYTTCGLLIALAVIAAGVVLSDSGSDRNFFASANVWADQPSSGKPAEKRKKPPPLSLDGFLDEKLPEAKPMYEGPLADNSACYVCHGNYDGEELALIHAKEDTGCVECHGQSYEHRNDEDNITPPDIMYAEDAIEKACVKCHETHDVPAKKVITRWRQRCPAKQNPQELVCTDCHGRHRLNFRTVWWDKKTRKLIIRDKQRTKVARDLTKLDKDQGSAKQGEESSDQIQ